MVLYVLTTFSFAIMAALCALLADLLSAASATLSAVTVSSLFFRSMNACGTFHHGQPYSPKHLKQISILATNSVPDFSHRLAKMPEEHCKLP